MIIAMLLVRLAPGVLAMSLRVISVVDVAESTLTPFVLRGNGHGLIHARQLQRKVKDRRRS